MSAAPDPNSFAEGIKTHPAPDLQELIDRFGGSYRAVTPEAWAEWDAANEAGRPRARRGWHANSKGGETNNAHRFPTSEMGNGRG